MNNAIPYLFSSQRLGFRGWQDQDLIPFSAINADPEVMRFFQSTLSQHETGSMMERMNRMLGERGYCYFAVELLGTGELIGTIGLGWKTFEASFTPCVDIGWRIGRKFWNQGLATEGASRCLDVARELGIRKVLSLASATNVASTRVMKKIGMQYELEFEHPDLKEYPHLQPCELYGVLL